MEYLSTPSFFFMYFACNSDKLVFRVPSNSPDIYIPDLGHAAAESIKCPKCHQRLPLSGKYTQELYETAYVQSLNEKIRRLEERVARMDELERRVSEIEYAPTGGPEFLKLVEEAKAAGDFQ